MTVQPITGGTITSPIRHDLPVEEDALVVLATATDGTACPVHDVGPVAAHLVGPVCAFRPDWHPRQRHAGSRERSTAALNSLVARCTPSLPAQHDDWTCSCPPGFQPSPLLFVVPRIAEVAVARPPKHTCGSEVDAAIYSADPDTALRVLDGRLDALLVLSDRARAVNGGTLPDDVADAVRTLALTLTGRGRWDIVRGWESGFDWPVAWRFGAVALKANSFLLWDEVADRIIHRLIEGR